ncbi:hypothetical protein PAXINDRAFT_9040 [Paxillus involutus ATCC 200175]|nr:hypothetical protein PAXINDRAFT_9040 [Paxillus involutus ATCC 200175]
MHCTQSYHHTILVNVPLQISVAQEAGRVIVGRDNGFARIFNYRTGAFREKLDHGSGIWRLIVAVTAFEGTHGCTIATASALDGHSSIKVWSQQKQMASQPLSVTTESPPASSLKQIVVFAIICIFIKIFMRYLPSFPVEIPSSIFGLLSSLRLKDL